MQTRKDRNLLNWAGWSLLLALSWVLVQSTAHAQPFQLTIQSGNTPAPQNVGGQVIGAFGGTPIYYWVAANFPAGQGPSTGPVTVTRTVGVPNLTIQNYVLVSWAPVPGALSYDVWRSDSPNNPVLSGACASCGVVASTPLTTANDQGTGFAYTAPAQIQSGQASLTIDNQSNTTGAFMNMAFFNGQYRLGLFTGTWNADDCVKINGSGFLQSAGAACGSGGGGGLVSSVSGDGFKTSVSPTTGATVVSLTSEMPGRSEPAVITAARDFSGAGQLIIPRGAGAPPAAGCDSGPEVGNFYIDSTALPSVSGLYACLANSGVPAWVMLPRTGGQSLTAVNSGFISLGYGPMGDAGAGTTNFAASVPYCFVENNPFTTLNIGKITGDLAVGDAARYAALAIYNSVSGTLLATSNTINLNTTGPRTFTFAPFALTESSYIWCYAQDGGTTANWYGQSGPASRYRIVLGSLSTPRIFTTPATPTTGTTTIVFPATLGARVGFGGATNLLGLFLEP